MAVRDRHSQSWKTLLMVLGSVQRKNFEEGTCIFLFYFCIWEYLER